MKAWGKGWGGPIVGGGRGSSSGAGMGASVTQVSCERGAEPHFYCGGARQDKFPVLEGLIVTHPGVVERAKQFFFRNFERTFVVLLVASLLAINYVVDDKIAFLSFYYLPIILAGFFGGRRFAVFAALFIALLVFYYQAVLGLQPDMLPGLHLGAMLTLVPWAGFLILTGDFLGMLAEDRAPRLTDG